MVKFDDSVTYAALVFVSIDSTSFLLSPFLCAGELIVNCLRIHCTLGVMAICSSSVLAQGLIAPGAGPINQSMAGASTAAPVDFGSSYWNPATLSGLERQEFLLGSSLNIPSTHLTTSIPKGSINGILPLQNRFGTARSDSGVIPSLATGVAWRMADDSPLTFGLGIFGLAGGNVNYAGNPSIPLLGPRRPPRNYGVGPIYANAAFLSVNPMLSYRVTEKLSIGGGPMITSGSMSLNPAFFAPEKRPGSLFPSFPAATNARPFWGAGFQLGLLYELNESWNLGFSYKSPIWQERWAFNSATADLQPKRIGIQAQLPAITSWGIAYKGIDRLLIDVDFRYMDYANTSLFGQKVADGGLGWQSVFAFATRIQYALTDQLTLRAGYLFNTNPIRNENTLFNVQLPGIVTNSLSFGSSLKLTKDVTLSAAWVHGFRNSIQGNVVERSGAFSRFDTQLDSIVMGLNVQFGGKRRPKLPELPTYAPAAVPEPMPTQTVHGSDSSESAERTPHLGTVATESRDGQHETP